MNLRVRLRVRIFLLKRSNRHGFRRRYRQLSETELTAMLRSLPKRPLLADEAGIRLAGKPGAEILGLLREFFRIGFFQAREIL